MQELSREKLLLRDVLFALQGVDGQFLFFAAETESYQFHPDALPNFTRATQVLTLRICEIGYLYRRCVSFVETFESRQESASPTRIEQVFILCHCFFVTLRV